MYILIALALAVICFVAALYLIDVEAQARADKITLERRVRSSLGSVSDEY